MSVTWRVPARGLLAASRGASSSASSSSVAARTTERRPFCVCGALFSTSTWSAAEQKAQRKRKQGDALTTSGDAVPLQHDAGQASNADVQKGVKGIEYINAERTWGGVPVPLYPFSRYSTPPPPVKRSEDLSQPGDTGPASLSGAIHADEAMRRNDPALCALTTSLTKVSDKGNLVLLIDICTDIKRRLAEMASAKSNGGGKGALTPTTIYPPMIVYDKMLKAFAMYGDVVACDGIIQDMRATGKVPIMEQLDWLLLAAVQSGDHEEVDKVLQLIADFNTGENAASQQTPDDAKPELPSSTLLSTACMRNWTPTTYRHMLLYCMATKNLEYGMALLGAASQRSKAEAQQRSDVPVSFLRQVLTPATVRHVLSLALDNRQARLAADLAAWLKSGVARRRVDVQSWMDVLRCCADQDYFPGVAIAWDESVERGMLQPDEGLLLAVLNCASRGRRRSAFIQRALDTFERQAPSTFLWQEWHLMPLLEAQCLEHDFEAAMRTATRIALTTDVQVRSPPPVRLLGLLRMASASQRAMISVYHAFLTVGRAKDVDGERGGVTTEVMNALLRAANSLGLNDAALKVYGVRHYLRNERTPPSTRLPKLPKMYADILKSDQTTSNVMLTLDAVRAAEKGESPKDDDHAHRESQVDALHPQKSSTLLSPGAGLRPDVHTINALLSTAINMKSAVLGRFALDQLIAHQLEADATTYERAIVLAVTQPQYEAAFELLESAKAHSIVPTRDSYRALATRCRQDDDERWIKVLQEMARYGQWPGRDLTAALVQAGHPDPFKRPDFTRE